MPLLVYKLDYFWYYIGIIGACLFYF